MKKAISFLCIVLAGTLLLAGCNAASPNPLASSRNKSNPNTPLATPIPPTQSPPLTFATGGVSIGRQGNAYVYTPLLTTTDASSRLKCVIGVGETCGGTMPTDTFGFSPHMCTTYTFVPGVGLQACVVAIRGVDDKIPANSATQMTSITFNRNPSWSTAPANISITTGSVYNQTNGIAADADTPAQGLTCSSNGTNCTFTPSVSGSGMSPTSCNVSFTAGAAQTCNLRIMVTDNGSPAGSVGATVLITVKSFTPPPPPPAPAFSTVGPTAARQGVSYSYAAALTDSNSGVTLRCIKGVGDTCGGTMPADTPGAGPHTCPAYTFTPGAASQSCVVSIRGVDNGVPALSATQVTTVTINRTPTWSAAPANVSITSGSVYNQINGIATDVDAPAQALTCSSNGTSCTFTPTVSGSGAAPRSCNVSFTAGSVQTCNLRITATDAGIPAATVGSTIQIIVKAAPPPPPIPTFSTTGPTTARQGVAYNYTPALVDSTAGITLKCVKGVGDTCGGTLPADAPGASPHTCSTYTFTPGAAAQSCVVSIRGVDNSVPAQSVTQTTTLTINRNPTWSTAPAGVGITSGSVYNKTNGVATDPDLPAQTLVCSINGTSCSFTPTVSGTSKIPTSCNVNFTAGAAQTCNLRIRVTDSGIPAATVGSTVQIIVTAAPPPPAGGTIVIAYNDLGMNVMNQDFSEYMLMPPNNNLYAQVITRGNPPLHVNTGIQVTYSIPNNTTSSGKTNFWTYANSLLGLTLSPNIGITNKGLAGTMVNDNNGNYVATGIPITPMNDSNTMNPYQLATVVVTQNQVELARTQTVIPVSWEINCNLCHNTPGISTALDILRKHDSMHGTNFANSKPIACGRCHAQGPLSAFLPGSSGLPTLSRAIHRSHSSRMAQAGLANECFACHPGLTVQYQRDVHLSFGLNCKSCHVSMTALASSTRRPWVDEPHCSDCHSVTGHTYEQAGKLFKDSKGHGTLDCATCHNSPHAITPTVDAADNTQAIALQGVAGPLNQCTICHTVQPTGTTVPHPL